MFKKKEIAYGIIGLGRFGYALATELTASGAEILVLDKNEEKIREMRELTENAFVVRNLDKNTLMETGNQNCDVAIVCIGEQIATSILTTLNLVGLGIPKVVSKATSMEHGEILKKLGAEVVYPEQDMAVRLAHRLETSKVLDYIQLSERLNISKMAVPAGIIGKTVLEVDLRGRFGLNIIAVENAGGLVDSVKPEYTFREGDILFVAGGTEGFSERAAWMEND